MRPVKKSLLVIASISLIAVGSTFAYLHDTSNTSVNAFSSDRQLSLKLREPDWDGYQFDDEYPSTDEFLPGEQAKPEIDPSTLGITKAQNYLPGYIIPKNPIVKNTSDNEKEIIAIKLQYILFEDGKEIVLNKQDFNRRYAVTKGSADINADGINDTFTLISSSQDMYDLYLYGDIKNPVIVDAGKTSAYLFDQVLIDNNIKRDENGKWPNFRIKVTAYAVQSENIDVDAAINQLKKLANQTRG